MHCKHREAIIISGCHAGKCAPTQTHSDTRRRDFKSLRRERGKRHATTIKIHTTQMLNSALTMWKCGTVSHWLMSHQFINHDKRPSNALSINCPINFWNTPHYRAMALHCIASVYSSIVTVARGVVAGCIEQMIKFQKFVSLHLSTHKFITL